MIWQKGMQGMVTILSPHLFLLPHADEPGLVILKGLEIRLLPRDLDADQHLVILPALRGDHQPPKTVAVYA
jgi:hypothetical protein